MDYEKAYNEALKRAKNLENTTAKENTLIEYLFPELKESEDERVIKRLSSLVRTLNSEFFKGDNPSKEQCLAYLERQKEQKPIKCIDFDNEFENQVSHLIASILNGEHEYSEEFVKYAVQSLLGYAKNELKPVEWSEEDEGMINCIISTLCEESHGGREINERMVSWLEKLRKFLHPKHITYTLDAPLGYDKDMNPIYPPINHWKPSKEQMDALKESSTSWMNEYMGNCEHLKSLYNDLKKL